MEAELSNTLEHQLQLNQKSSCCDSCGQNSCADRVLCKKKHTSSEKLEWDEMIQILLDMFEADNVIVEEIEEILTRYDTDINDWGKFAKFDKYKYTRNLVHEGNDKFNLMLLCWAEGNQSTIHDHSDAHCFVKVLQGGLNEVKFYWPEEKTAVDGTMAEKDQKTVKSNGVCYMSDELGLHRIENISHNTKAVSLHLYSPPFQACQVFDERTGKKMTCPMTFWSKYGEKVNNCAKK